jgi:hypothetical protein
MTDAQPPLSNGKQITAFKRLLTRHVWLAFVLMGASFLITGLISLNLIYLFHANIEFVIENGVMGLRDGGLLQFLELLVSGYLGMAFFVVFKACEKVVVDGVLERSANQ